MKTQRNSYYIGAALIASLTLAGCNNGRSQIVPLEAVQQAAIPHGTPRAPRPRMRPSFTSLYSFLGGTDGSSPNAGLTAVNGVLYGTTLNGGNSGSYGTVYSITPSAQEQVLYRFGGPPNDGAFPSAELVELNNALYGTTRGGGSGGCKISEAYGCGTIFSVGTSGQEEYLYSFKGGTIDGQFPFAGVTARNGALFGTTESGGSFADGMVFAITVYGEEGDAYNFRGKSYGDGAVPQANLVQVGSAEFYGTTQQGGVGKRHCGALYGCGTVFGISPGGREGILYSFKGGRDAWGPVGSIVSFNGRLYGTAKFGGADRKGAVYWVTTGGHEKVLHSFQGGADGSNPAAGLIVVNKTFYGTTSGGGSSNCSGGCGTIFSIAASGKEKVLHSFNGTDGASPVGRLIQVGSAVYGTTSAGGTSNLGTVFELSLK